MNVLTYNDSCEFREYDFFVDGTVIMERTLLKYFKTKKVVHVRLSRRSKRTSSYFGQNHWFWITNQDEVDRKSNRVLNTAYQRWQTKSNGDSL